MKKIPLLPCNIANREAYLENRGLPANYMEDFSLLGFVVEPYERAVDVLRDFGFSLKEQPGGADISLNSSVRLPEIAELLAANNVRCDFTDIADTFYQA